MLRIGNTIFSLDILDKKFRCDLSECFGHCCRYGDAGAPVTEEEVKILDSIWPEIKQYLRSEAISVIENEGTSVMDFENERVTPLIGNEECAYTVLSDNIYMCGFEKAWAEGKITFQKPISCHLFPAKIKQHSDFRAVNYQELSICSAARSCGSHQGVYLYEFLREPLIRAFGPETYESLCIAAGELRRHPGKFPEIFE